METPAGGTVEFDPATGFFVYSANPGFEGDDTFAYTVADDCGIFATAALVTVHVIGASVINYLNRRGASPADEGESHRLDVNGDRDVTSTDALMVINLLNDHIYKSSEAFVDIEKNEDDEDDEADLF